MDKIYTVNELVEEYNKIDWINLDSVESYNKVIELDIWQDWWCKNVSLVKRTHRLMKLVKRIKTTIDLNAWTINFKNRFGDAEDHHYDSIYLFDDKDKYAKYCISRFYDKHWKIEVIDKENPMIVKPLFDNLTKQEVIDWF